MQFQPPSRGGRVAMLAGLATLAFAAPASAIGGVVRRRGNLTAYLRGTENVELAGDPGGKVVLNGADTTIDAADVKTIEVAEDPAGIGANTVDLSGVQAAAYTQLTATTILAAGGDDTLTGSPFADRIVGGRQADTMSGKDGDDTLVWNNGDGSDVMNGGDGIDTIESNGADTGSPWSTRPTRSRPPARASSSSASRGPFTLDVGGASSTSTTSRAAPTSSPRSTRPCLSPASP